ncbi:MAG: alpha/beta hydrolase [Gammaproteobacteria bacterium]|nr:alpha/beta hydrolase [Gammaproteobacteria bacterium]
MSQIAEQRISISGPAGTLEAVVSIPEEYNQFHAVSVVCHPHPLHGGTMDNKVAHTLAKAFNSLNVPAIRFNFRGVGKSTGQFAEAIGETEDALAVIHYAQSQFPDHDIWLGGFSFGAYIALRVSQQIELAQLITVSPAVNLYALDDYRSPTCPWLLIQGEDDEIVPVESVKTWADQVQPPPQLHLMPETGHFFHGRLIDLRDAIIHHLEQTT